MIIVIHLISGIVLQISNDLCKRIELVGIQGEDNFLAGGFKPKLNRDRWLESGRGSSRPWQLRTSSDQPLALPASFMIFLI